MYLQRLFPAPVSFKEDESSCFLFGASVRAEISGLEAGEIERVMYLWRRFSCDASALSAAASEDGFSLKIGSADAVLNDGDSYSINVSPSGVCVRAADGKSLLDGISTLVQLIVPKELGEGRESFYISSAEVHDAPAIPFRAVHFCVFPETKLYNIEKSIHLAGFLKMTHVILEFWGTYRFECRPELSWEGHSYTKAEIKPLIDLARSYGMEVIPMSNQFGHATQSRGGMGRHVVLNRNQRLSRLFEPDGWTWCLSNPDTYKLLADIREELSDLCGEGKYFHLGFDESYSFATCDLCRRRVPHELLAEFINRLTEDVCRTGRRPILWHDMFINRSDFGEGDIVANGSYFKDTYKAIDLLDRRIIMADWQYGYKNDFNPTTKFIMDKGFDTVVCPWDNWENIRSLSADAKRLGAYGIILTTWDHLPAWMHCAAHAASCVWEKSTEMPKLRNEDAACILRRVYDTEGDFEKSGWNMNEVWQ